MMSRTHLFNNGHIAPRGGLIHQPYHRMSHGISYHPIFGYGLFGGKYYGDEQTFTDTIRENAAEYNDGDGYTIEEAIKANENALMRAYDEGRGDDNDYRTEIEALKLLNLVKSRAPAGYEHDEHENPNFNVLSDVLSYALDQVHNKSINELSELELDKLMEGIQNSNHKEEPDTQPDTDVLNLNSEIILPEDPDEPTTISKILKRAIVGVKDLLNYKKPDDKKVGFGIAFEHIIISDDTENSGVFHNKQAFDPSEKEIVIEVFDNVKQFISEGEQMIPVAIDSNGNSAYDRGDAKKFEEATKFSVIDIKTPKAFIDLKCLIETKGTVETPAYKGESLLKSYNEYIASGKTDDEFTDKEKQDMFTPITKNKIVASSGEEVVLWETVNGRPKVVGIVMYKNAGKILDYVVEPYNQQGRDLEFAFMSNDCFAKVNVSDIESFKFVDSVTYRIYNTRTIQEIKEKFPQFKNTNIMFGSLDEYSNSINYLVSPKYTKFLKK